MWRWWEWHVFKYQLVRAVTLKIPSFIPQQTPCLLLVQAGIIGLIECIFQKIYGFFELVDTSWLLGIGCLSYLYSGKHGFIDNDLPPILNRIGFETEQWQTMVTDCEGRNKTIAGAAEVVRDKCHLFGKRWIHGIKGRHLLFGWCAIEFLTKITLASDLEMIWLEPTESGMADYCLSIGYFGESHLIQPLFFAHFTPQRLSYDKGFFCTIK